MRIIIEARRFSARDELKEYIEKEVQRLNRYFDRIHEVEVTLEGKLNRKEAMIRVKVPDQTLVASEIAGTFEIATESAVDKLAQQVKKYKEKMRKY